MHAARYTNLLLEDCDLLIGLGVRFDDRATGKAAEFCPRAKILHIDIDPSELGKIKQPSVGIVADVGDARSSRASPRSHAANG
jgi:acetolactate synthase-1/2/3 large subunit